MIHLTTLKKQVAAIVVVGTLAFTLFFFYTSTPYTTDALVKAYRVDISSDIPGRVTHLYVDEGETLKKDDRVFQLETSRIDAALQTAYSSIKAAKQAINTIHYKECLAFDNFQRGAAAYNKNVIPFNEYDTLEKEYLQIQEEKKLLQAKKDVIENEYSALLIERDHALTIADVGGVVAKRWHAVGDVVSPGETVFTLFDLKDIWIEAYFDEKYLTSIPLGTKVEVFVDAYKGVTLKGEVFALQNATQSNFSLLPMNNATGNFTKVSQRVPVKIKVDCPEGIELYPGLSCEVRVKN